jgi:hypothetical protein
MLATLVLLAALSQTGPRPTIEDHGTVAIVRLPADSPDTTIDLEDDYAGTIYIFINDDVITLPGWWYSRVIYIDGTMTTNAITYTNDTYVPSFVAGGAGKTETFAGFAGETVYCGTGDTVVHGRNANLAFVVGHPKADTVIFHVDQSAASVILEYVNDSRTRYNIVGMPTAKWER